MWDRIAALRRRKLGQWAIAYVAAAWGLLQLSDLLGAQFDWPQPVVRGITVVLAMGFLAALVLAWFHGERGRQRVGGVESALLAGIGVTTVAVVSLVAGHDSRTGSALPLRRVPERGSVAVLPFVDMSREHDQEYFSDGVTEELLNALAQVPGLRVAARTSSFGFRGTNADVRDIAAKLGVASIVEGSVRSSGQRVRVTAQLIDATSGDHVWSQTYDRTVSDVLALQEDVARAIAGALRLRLEGPGEQARLMRSQTDDATAYDLYLRGRYFWNQRTPEGLSRARDYFQQAVARDSTYAAAYAGLADVYISMFDYELMPLDSARAASRAAAERALALDPESAEAHNSLAHVYLHDWMWADSEREFRRAIELDPNYAAAYHWYALCLTAIGRLGEAVDVMREAYRLDRMSPRISADLGMALYAARANDEAIEQERRTLEMDPQMATAVWITGMAQQANGDYPAAIASYQSALERQPDNINYLAALASAQARSGNTAEARRLLASMQELANGDPEAAFFLALVYTALGQDDDAIGQLTIALRHRSGSIRYLKIEPRLDPLRADPRFKQLLKQAGLPA